MKYLFYEQVSSSGCCGVHEICDMEVANSEDKEYSYTEPVKLEEALAAMFEEGNGRPLLFNFVRCRAGARDWSISKEQYAQLPFKRRFEAEEFRRIVMAHPKCLDLGKTINPGTMNQIHTLFITGYKVK